MPVASTSTSLQKYVVVLATVECVCDGILFLVNTILLIRACLLSREVVSLAFLAFQAVVILICVLRMALAWYLWNAARNENYKACKKWMIITVVIIVLHLASFGNSIVHKSYVFEFYWNSIRLVYKFIEMVVVYKYVGQLKEASNVPVGRNYADENE